MSLIARNCKLKSLLVLKGFGDSKLELKLQWTKYRKPVVLITIS
jgi:hypothetical protein